MSGGKGRPRPCRVRHVLGEGRGVWRSTPGSISIAKHGKQSRGNRPALSSRVRASPAASGRMRLHPEQTLSAEVVMVTAAWSATPKDETPLPRPHDQSPMAIDLKEDRPAAWLAREVDHHVNNLLGLIQ